MSKQKIFSVISLFSGCGGMDLGFSGGFTFLGKKYHKLPFNTVFAVDCSKFAVKTFNQNFSNKSVTGDVYMLNLKTLPEADLIIGGLPSGKKVNTPLLYSKVTEIIDHVKPKMFVLELVDTPKNGQLNSELQTFINTLNNVGYTTKQEIIKAVDYGVPQTRVRLFLVGKQKIYPHTIFFPTPTHTLLGNSKKKPYVTTFDAIHDLENLLDNPTAPLNHTIKDYSKVKFVPNKKFQGNDKENKNKPARTVRAEAHGHQYGHYNSVGGDPDSLNMETWRRLSVRECARLQSFPDSFVFPVSQTEAHKQIGNATPPVLAWHVAKNVTKTLRDIQFTLSLKNITERRQ